MVFGLAKYGVYEFHGGSGGFSIHAKYGVYEFHGGNGGFLVREVRLT